LHEYSCLHAGSLTSAIELHCLLARLLARLPRACRSVQSVLDEMAAVLADSGRSMRDMSTDTREQQREWWRVR
jgi:hypothetical protein